MGPPASDEAAVSSVVSAVLIFALFSTASLLWTFQTLPVWVEDKEEAHQATAAQQFIFMQAAVDDRAAADDQGIVAMSLPLAPRPVNLLQTAPATGSLGFEGGVTASATFTGASLLVADGVVLGTPSEPIDGDVLGSVVSLDALTIRLTTTSIGNNDDGWAQVQVTDGVDTVSARIEHVGRNGATMCQESQLHVLIDDGATSTTHLEACGIEDDLGGHAVDLLAPKYQLASLVAGLQAPRTLTFTDGSTGGTATGMLQAVWRDGDGLLQAAGAGSPSNLVVSQTGGRLLYEPAYQELQRQALSYEGGAVVRTQGDGQAMRSAPTWDLQVDGNTAHLSWTLVELTGSGGISGSGTATARLRVTEVEQRTLDVTGATFDLETPGAAAWRTFWADQMLLAGIATDAVVSGTGDAATLTLTTGTDVDAWRISLRTVTLAAEVS